MWLNGNIARKRVIPAGSTPPPHPRRGTTMRSLFWTQSARSCDVDQPSLQLDCLNAFSAWYALHAPRHCYLRRLSPWTGWRGILPSTSVCLSKCEPCAERHAIVVPLSCGTPRGDVLVTRLRQHNGQQQCPRPTTQHSEPPATRQNQSAISRNPTIGRTTPQSRPPPSGGGGVGRCTCGSVEDARGTAMSQQVLVNAKLATAPWSRWL